MAGGLTKTKLFYKTKIYLKIILIYIEVFVIDVNEIHNAKLNWEI